MFVFKYIIHAIRMYVKIPNSHLYAGWLHFDRGAQTLGAQFTYEYGQGRD